MLSCVLTSLFGWWLGIVFVGGGFLFVSVCCWILFVFGVPWVLVSAFVLLRLLYVDMVAFINSRFVLCC